MRIFNRVGWIFELLLGSLQSIVDPIQDVFDLLSVGLGVTGKVLLNPVYYVVTCAERCVGVFKMQQYPVLEARDADDGVQGVPLGVGVELVQSSVERFVLVAVKHAIDEIVSARLFGLTDRAIDDADGRAASGDWEENFCIGESKAPSQSIEIGALGLTFTNNERDRTGLSLALPALKGFSRARSACHRYGSSAPMSGTAP